MESKRILLTVSYDGTAYCGWQYQDNGISIQQKVEEALDAYLRSKYPGITIEYRSRRSYSSDDPALWAEMQRRLFFANTKPI